MSTTRAEKHDSDLLMTPADIYRAAAEGVLPQSAAVDLVEWGYRGQSAAVGSA